ncbi:hypothetical protein CAP50_02055 [Psychrobacter sp. L7]|nr:hypothetical protein CAP50_02055 [Psychrobacter sp. L7]
MCVNFLFRTYISQSLTKTAKHGEMPARVKTAANISHRRFTSGLSLYVRQRYALTYNSLANFCRFAVTICKAHSPFYKNH